MDKLAGSDMTDRNDTAQNTLNADANEIARFAHIASSWWDTEGEFKSLHDINPLRVDYITKRAVLAARRVLDVGCGGGILSESLAARGAVVTGIDLVEAALATARLHLLESGLRVDYRCISVEELAAQGEKFDVITCLEMLEHVPDPASVVRACAHLVKPGGHVFFSTLNRNVKSYAYAILGAEFVLRLLPKGTHDYSKFIRPSELDSYARAAGLRLHDLTGLSYLPLFQRYYLSRNIDVNYLAWATRPAVSQTPT